MPSYPKDPDAKLPYLINWGAKWLGEDTIDISTWEITGAPDDELLIESDTFDDTTTTVWLIGGTVKKTYRVTNHIVTAGGLEDDRTLVINCINR